MGNANSNKANMPIVVNIKYSKLEKLITNLKECLNNLANEKINSSEELEKCEYNNNFIHFQDEINNELMIIRNSISNDITNMSDYTKSTIKLKKYIFVIQLIIKKYFEIVKNINKSYL